MKQIANHQLLRAYLLGLFAVIAFGATLPVTRLALPDFSPWLLTFLRALIATTLAAICLWWVKKPVHHPQSLKIFLAGLLLVHGFPGFMAIAMQTVPASHGGVVLGFLPLATAVVASLIAGEKPSTRFWILSLVGFLIIASYIISQEDELGTSGVSSGDVWLVLAGLSASTGYVLFGQLSRMTPGWEVISRALLLNTPITLFGAWYFYEPSALTPSATGLASLLYLGVFSMFLAFCAWNVALAIGGISRIGQLQLLQTFATLAIASLLLGESIDATTLAVAVAIALLIAASRKG